MPLIGAATVCVLRADRPPARQRGPRSLIPAAARGPGLALALASVGVAAVTGFALLLAEDRDISGGALVWPAFGAGLVLARLCFGRLPDTLGARRCATVSCLVQGAGILCLAAAPNLPVALAGAAIAGGGSALVFPALVLLVVGRTPDDQRGAAIGGVHGLLRPRLRRRRRDPRRRRGRGGLRGSRSPSRLRPARSAHWSPSTPRAARRGARPGRPRRRPGGRRHSPRDASTGSRPVPAFTRPARVQRGMCEPSVT